MLNYKILEIDQYPLITIKYTTMAKVCEICGRGTNVSASRSHSHIKTLKKQYINLQTKKIDGKKTKICTKCLKTITKK